MEPEWSCYPFNVRKTLNADATMAESAATVSAGDSVHETFQRVAASLDDPEDISHKLQ
jgi:hypothetical protein